MRTFVLFLLTLAICAVAIALFQFGSAARQISADIEKVEADVQKVEADVHGVQGDFNTIVQILQPIQVAVDQWNKVNNAVPSSLTPGGAAQAAKSAFDKAKNEADKVVEKTCPKNLPCPKP